MGTCPNCGNWVEDGDVCGVCGGSSNYSLDYEEKEESNITQSNTNSYYPKHRSNYTKARDYFKKSEYQKTVNCCNTYNNGEINIIFLKAQALFELKLYKESLKCCEECLKKQDLNFHQEMFLKDNQHKMIELKGDCLFLLKRYEEAIKTYEEGLEHVKKSDRWTFAVVFDKARSKEEDAGLNRLIQSHRDDRYDTIGRLVASKMIGLQILGQIEKAQDLLNEYIYIINKDYPIYGTDRYSSKKIYIFPYIKKKSQTENS